MNGVQVSARLVIPEAELSERFSRSSGPGGQGVNTADSRVELSWDIDASSVLTEELRARLRLRLASRLVGGVLTIAASEHRAQLANRRTARERLAAIVREALAPPAPKRRPTRPTFGSKQRRLASKKRRSDIKKTRQGRWD